MHGMHAYFYCELIKYMHMLFEHKYLYMYECDFILDIYIKFARSSYHIHSPFKSVKVLILLSKPASFRFNLSVFEEHPEGKLITNSIVYAYVRSYVCIHPLYMMH